MGTVRAPRALALRMAFGANDFVLFVSRGTALRLVDNKAILYFDAPSPSAALNWYRGAPPPLIGGDASAHSHSYFTAINLHIPASKT